MDHLRYENYSTLETEQHMYIKFQFGNSNTIIVFTTATNACKITIDYTQNNGKKLPVQCHLAGYHWAITIVLLTGTVQARQYIQNITSSIHVCCPSAWQASTIDDNSK